MPLPGGTNPPSQGWRRVCGPLALSIALAAGGCVEEQTATLVPLFGCDLGESFDRRLRLQARGDFSATPQIADPNADLTDVPSSVRGITIEQVSDDTVEVVGRTARLASKGQIPVYFSPPERWCPMASDVSGREIGAVAVGPEGRVVAVGGRTPMGQLVDSIVSVRDVDGIGIEYERGLPEPAVGQTIHAIGVGRFAVIGGATDNGVLADVTVVEVGAEPTEIEVGPAQSITYADGPDDPGRAFHASAALPDGRIAVVGGCSLARDAGCDTSPGSVLGSGFVIAGDDLLEFESIPPLFSPRFGHDLLVARDGALFAVGGRDVQGVAERSIELFLPKSGEWLPYGPSLLDFVVDDVEIVGSTLLEGGIIVLVLSTGQVVWLDQENRGAFPGWCEADPDDPEVRLEPCFVASGPGIDPRRRVATLPGERILVDNYVLGVGQLGRTGFDVLDLSVAQGLEPPPRPRIGAFPRVLVDGSVLLAGGINPISGINLEEMFARFRPGLDGPDEVVPNVAGLAPGSLIIHDPGDADPPRIEVAGGRLAMRPDPSLSLDRLTTWVRVRSFRSQRFRFEATLEAQQEARPRIVLTRGAISRAVLRFDESEVRMTVRDETGSGFSVACSSSPLNFSGVAVPTLAIITPDRIEVRAGGEVVTCPGLGPGELSVGLGAAGNGTINASDLRLSRL